MTNYLISHIFDKNGKLQATLVITKARQVGISITSETERFPNKKLGIHLALNRALNSEKISLPKGRKVLILDKTDGKVKRMDLGKIILEAEANLGVRASRYFDKPKQEYLKTKAGYQPTVTKIVYRDAFDNNERYSEYSRYKFND